MRSSHPSGLVLTPLLLFLISAPMAEAAGTASASDHNYQGHYDAYNITQSIPPALVHNYESDAA